jgi:hypothetical protein
MISRKNIQEINIGFGATVRYHVASLLAYGALSNRVVVMPYGHFIFGPCKVSLSGCPHSSSYACVSDGSLCVSTTFPYLTSFECRIMIGPAISSL